MRSSLFMKFKNKSGSSLKSLSTIFKKKNTGLFNSNNDYFKKVLIHIHGGGFIGSSSSFHQIYLRKMAINLDKPIFSIDYRLVPFSTYPNTIYDCITGIFWIFQFVRDVLNTEIEEYVLFGDSAGGNLVIAVVHWLIENKIKKLPKLISLQYPLTNYR